MAQIVIPLAAFVAEQSVLREAALIAGMSFRANEALPAILFSLF